jgi:trk system potassium uptake protein TrkA
MFYNKNEFIIVAGSGRFGSAIADSLSLSGFDVTVIDKDENSFRHLSISYGGFQYLGDATSIDVLGAAGIKRASMLIACTNNDNVNSLIAQVASRIFGVRKVFARIGENEKIELIEGYNIVPICPFELSLEDFWKKSGISNKEDKK